jgi:hypothetical protein
MHLLPCVVRELDFGQLEFRLVESMSHPKNFDFGLCIENINKNKYFDICIKFTKFSLS